MNRNEFYINKILYLNLWAKSDLLIDNVFLPNCQWESDLIRLVKRTHYLIEYEIKSSKSDFLSELKNKNLKHIFYQSKKSPVNKLYFILNFNWDDEILESIPERFGAIQIENDLLQIVKPAYFFHKEKCCKNVINSLLWVIGSRYFSNKLELMGIKYEAEDKKFDRRYVSILQKR